MKKLLLLITVFLIACPGPIIANATVEFWEKHKPEEGLPLTHITTFVCKGSYTDIWEAVSTYNMSPFPCAEDEFILWDHSLWTEGGRKDMIDDYNRMFSVMQGKGAIRVETMSMPHLFSYWIGIVFDKTKVKDIIDDHGPMNTLK